jgi:FtsP/CotA-like multicopper oxidase with cupredoxin domain
MRISALGTAVLFGLAACGGSDSPAPAATDSAPAAAPAAGLAMPAWYQVDEASQTVTLDITAGATNKGNYWNYNGYTNGEATIVVPVGYTVTINYTNQDPNMSHSIGVDSRTGGFPAAFTEVTPVFEGAVSANPTDQAQATQTGETETITFVASAPGSYSLVCYVPGHAAVGMWIGFEVVDGGDIGVR